VGLTTGEVVVTEGGDRLREGAQVILPQATPARPTAGAPGSTPPSGKRPDGAKGTRRAHPHPSPSQ